MSDLQKNFDDMFFKLRDKVMDVDYYQGFIRRATNKALKKNEDENIQIKELGISDSMAEIRNLICTDIVHGGKIVIGGKDISFSERFDIIRFHQNKQYQWLLVEAYEAFIDFVDSLYATLGVNDNDFWDKKDLEEKK